MDLAWRRETFECYMDAFFWYSFDVIVHLLIALGLLYDFHLVLEMLCACLVVILLCNTLVDIELARIVGAYLAIITFIPRIAAILATLIAFYCTGHALKLFANLVDSYYKYLTMKEYVGIRNKPKGEIMQLVLQEYARRSVSDTRLRELLALAGYSSSWFNMVSNLRN